MEHFLENVLERNNFLNVQSVFYRNLLARIAVYYCFMVEGELAGIWGRFLPVIQDDLGLSDSLLGTSVLFFYLGNVLAAPIDAILLKYFGSRFVSTLGCWCFILTMPLVALAPAFSTLTLAIFAFGLSCGIMDISMNNSAILTEIVAGIPLLGSFHGSYSVSAALGSLLGGVMVQENFSTLYAFLLVSAVALVLSFATFYNMYDQQQEHFLTSFHKDHGKVDIAKVAAVIKRPILADAVEDTIQYENENERATNDRRPHKNRQVTSALHESPSMNPNDRRVMGASSSETIFITPEDVFGAKPKRQHSRSRSKSSDGNAQMNSPLLVDPNDNDTPVTNENWKILAVFASIGFLGAFGESSIVTWSVIFFERYIGASSVVKSLGFTCFMVCMGVGRFLCDYLRRLIGRQYLMRIGGCLATSGLLVVVLSTETPSPVAFACIGFALTGLGLSTIIPTVFSSAGHLPGLRPGTALAIVAGCSYSGSIISSPLIGVLSDGFGSLQMAILCDAILLGLIIPFSFGVIPETNVFQSTSIYQEVVSDEQRPDDEEEEGGNYQDY